MRRARHSGHAAARRTAGGTDRRPSIGATRTDELAVMADTFAPLRATTAAVSIEDPGYQDSFR